MNGDLWGSLLIPVLVATAVYWLSQGVQSLLASRRAAQTAEGHTLNELRRDRIADRDALIDRLSARERSLERRLSELEAELLALRNYADVLRSHIWAKLPPPPPEQPRRGV